MRGILKANSNAAFVKTLRCKCSTRLICTICKPPVIITPTLLKDYDNPKILEVWDIAEKLLQNADKVVFVGYSLPDADIILRTMFTKSFYTNRVNLPQKNLTIEVVDYVEEPKRNLKVKPDTYDRYYKNFGSITYDWTGFSEYIERACVTIPVGFTSP